MPDDLLKDETGNFFPIRWMSYIKEVSKYQGAFEDKIKEKIHENFREKVEDIKKDNNKFNVIEWNKLKTIVDLIIKLFDLLEEI